MTNKTDRITYRLDNHYLNQDEKVLVESWFQLPGNIMEYTFWIMAVFSVFYPISFVYIFGVSIAVNIIVGLINWYFYNKKLTIVLGLSLFHPFVTAVVGIGVAIYLFINDTLLLAGISVFVGIFSFLFLELHILLYSFLAQKYKMHPKYVFAKKQFGHTFPFENFEE